MRAISKNTRKATAITLAAALVIAVYLNSLVESAYATSLRRMYV